MTVPKVQPKTTRRRDMRGEINEWVERNPLRIWRKHNNMSHQDTAMQLGVSWLSVSFWEKGATKPNADNMPLISYLIGVNNLKELWAEWYESRPKPIRDE